MVEQYTMAAIANASHPMTLSTSLYCFIDVIVLFFLLIATKCRQRNAKRCGAPLLVSTTK